MDCSPPGCSVHGIFPGKITGWDCYVLLQGIFLTQGLNPVLQSKSSPLSHVGSQFWGRAKARGRKGAGRSDFSPSIVLSFSFCFGVLSVSLEVALKDEQPGLVDDWCL